MLLFQPAPFLITTLNIPSSSLLLRNQVSSFSHHLSHHHIPPNQHDSIARSHEYSNGVYARKDQSQLEGVLRTLFPDVKLIVNARKDSDLRSLNTDQFLEVDLWMPSIKLGFEFQDAHHYVNAFYASSPLEDFHTRDQMKHTMMKEMGYDLVIVPCWWDLTKESLIGSIKHIRPDLLTDYPAEQAIPTEPPSHFFNVRGVPNVGELSLSVFYNSRYLVADPQWWLSEKYDGIRACFHPINREAYSRWGATFSIPAMLLGSMPNLFLDGELWFGRGSFKSAAMIVAPRSSALAHNPSTPPHDTSTPAHDPSSSTYSSSSIHDDSCDHEIEYVEARETRNMQWVEWQFLRLMAFESPQPSMLSLAFEDRYTELVSGIQSTHPLVQIVAFFRVLGDKMIRRSVQTIITRGGEGAVLRLPQSAYHHGRTQSSLKIKVNRDNEARVLSLNEDGTCVCQQGDEKSFIATVAKQEPLNISEGDIVSFRFSTYSPNGLPVNPEVFRMRPDLNWQDVIDQWNDSNYFREKSISDIRVNQTYTFSNNSSPIEVAHKPSGFWTSKDGANGRLFFIKFASKNNIDYTRPAHWYKVTKAQVVSAGGATLLTHFGGSHRKAIAASFPELPIIIDHWESRKARKPKIGKPIVRNRERTHHVNYRSFF